jgi:hypothetical protein
MDVEECFGFGHYAGSNIGVTEVIEKSIHCANIGLDVVLVVNFGGFNIVS